MPYVCEQKNCVPWEASCLNNSYHASSRGDGHPQKPNIVSHPGSTRSLTFLCCPPDLRHRLWDTTLGGPLLLIAGGSGIVPLMAMVRHRLAQRSDIPTRLLYSVRTPENVIYAKELSGLSEQHTRLDVIYTFTRQAPPNWRGYARRIDEMTLREVLQSLESKPRIYICGPTALVEVAANTLAGIGIDAESIRTERFGPTGGR